MQSLPSRERGLKWSPSKGRLYLERVAPLAGAWIEITPLGFLCTLLRVAPLAGAWIEILYPSVMHSKSGVAPLAGAWIEI